MMVNCRLCNFENVRIWKRSGRYTLVRCLKCGVIFVLPQQSIIHAVSINLDKYNSLSNKATYLKMQQIFKERATRCAQVLKLYKEKGYLLDIGCSYGFYLKVFNQLGFNTVGMDISKRTIDYVQNTLHLRGIKANIETYPLLEKSFDIITLFDVFEHFSDPNKMIMKVRRSLKPNGIIVIQTPNCKSIMARLTGIDWFWMLIPQHLFLYSISSLKYILQNNGFKILRIETWDDFGELTRNILWILNIKDSGKTKYLYRIILKIMTVFYPLTYLWNKLYLGGEIIVYAKKIAT